MRRLVAVGCIVASFAVSAVPAAAAVAPSPGHVTMQPDIGILAERRMMLGGSRFNSIPARPSQPLVACAAAWGVVDNRSGSWNNFLGGVSAVSPTDIWAVGNSQSAIVPSYGNGDQNLAEHWAGSDWTAVPTPNVGSDGNDLNDVAAITASDVWAIGLENTTGSFFAVAMHWNGGAWTTASLPGTPLNGPTAFNDIAAVATGDVWAVGQQLAYNSSMAYVQHGLIEHWNGSVWMYSPSPFVGQGDNVLYGVSALSSTDAWAVGYSRATNSSPRQSLIEHWNGTVWSVDTSPSVATGTLLSVATATTTDARAVGYADGSNGLPIGIGLIWNGTSWSQQGVSEPSVYGEKIGDVVYQSPNYWAVGYHYGNGPGPGPRQPFALESTGSNWMTFPLLATNGGGNNELFSVSVPVTGDVWGVGTYLTGAGIYKNLVENYSDLAAPTGVSALPGDQSAQVSWTPPCSGASAITKYTITAYDGCTIQGVVAVSAPASTAAFNGLTNGVAYTFKVAAVNGFGVGPQSAASAPITPAGPTKPTWVTACSSQQYTLTGSNGSTWTDIDAANLSVTFTPTVDSFAIVSGNADLWTADAGYNQDIGIAISGGIYPKGFGQPEAWKESGGFAGTFSPNAALVEKAIPVTAATVYTARLQWKANKPDPGSIFVGAGPIGSAFSPTRLMVQLIPKSAAIVFTASSTTQYRLTGNDGNTWVDMDPTNLKITFTWPTTGYLWGLVSANADLWTSDAGYNQDLGVAMTGGHYPSGSWLPEFWGESGGFGGTFSPNAAFVQAGVNDSTLSGTGGGTFSARLQWKANRSDPGSIYAGAGPIGGQFSPTTLTVILIPDPTFGYQATSWQYTQPNSDGSYWQEMDSNRLLNQGGIGGPATWSVSVGANLWTTVAGYNQDVGIMVSGGAYGSGTLVAWKESGGFAGTYSPNAAFVSVTLQLQAGSSYSWWVVWKANQPAQAANLIVEGAGNGSNISPVWLTSVRIN